MVRCWSIFCSLRVYLALGIMRKAIEGISDGIITVDDVHRKINTKGQNKGKERKRDKKGVQGEMILSRCCTA